MAFGEVGAKILAFKIPLDRALDRVNELTMKIADQRAQLATTWASIQKLFSGDLEKLAGATDSGNDLAKCVGLIGDAREQVANIKRLQAECSKALDAAKLALPDWAAHVTNGRHDTVPGRSTFFIATKSAGGAPDIKPLEPSTSKRPDQIADGETQLGRLFRDTTQGDY